MYIITLALKELEGEYLGLNQAAIILKVLDNFGIRNKLGYIVIDNTGTNDTLIKSITTTLYTEGVYYNTKQRRLRYNSYVINLAIQVFLFRKIVINYKFLENITVSPSDT